MPPIRGQEREEAISAAEPSKRAIKQLLLIGDCSSCVETLVGSSKFVVSVFGLSPKLFGFSLRLLAKHAGAALGDAVSPKPDESNKWAGDLPGDDEGVGDPFLPPALSRELFITGSIQTSCIGGGGSNQ